MKFDRDTYIEMIADKYVNYLNADDLADYVYNSEINYLKKLSDKELMERADDMEIEMDEDD